MYIYIYTVYIYIQWSKGCISSIFSVHIISVSYTLDNYLPIGGHSRKNSSFFTMLQLPMCLWRQVWNSRRIFYETIAYWGACYSLATSETIQPRPLKLIEVDWCIYASVKHSILGSDNGLLPGRHQAIIWTNSGILLIRTLGINFIEILIEINTLSFTKMHLKMSSVKWRHIISASMC